jgi:predicted DNA-binding transcriptional regulator AlpA
MALLDHYLTKAQAAAELGITDRTLNRWHTERMGPPRTKIGSRIYYRREAVAEWLKSREIVPTRSRRAA